MTRPSALVARRPTLFAPVVLHDLLDALGQDRDAFVDAVVRGNAAQGAYRTIADPRLPTAGAGVGGLPCMTVRCEGDVARLEIRYSRKRTLECDADGLAKLLISDARLPLSVRAAIVGHAVRAVIELDGLLREEFVVVAAAERAFRNRLVLTLRMPVAAL